MSNFLEKIKKKFSKKEELKEELITLDEYEKFVESEIVIEKFKRGLKKSRDNFQSSLNLLLSSHRSINEEFFEKLEEILIESDISYNTVLELTDSLKQEAKIKNIKSSVELQNIIIEKLVNIYIDEEEKTELNFQKNNLTVFLFVGVNGVGKTTSIGKLAYKLRKNGKKVLIAAGDTFRAGAIDQLDDWAKKSGVNIIKSKEGVDPASVIYDALQSAKANNYDVLLCDTAGRLQNKDYLMKELEKIIKIIKRENAHEPQEVLLTIDATTGQNGIIQAKAFKEICNVSGVILTKLDGTAKGGIVISIKNELDIPVKLVGLGEGLDDLEKFDSEKYIYSLFDKSYDISNEENDSE
ncbi:signal recognition particle-docking protein FtsY [Gemelliphila asaccharolytica]|uniref:Signal recognition particle receptor FtsY n=1 Tax=Gemelliphila asaccharolytica TaxID=502393 RepID=A0ABR5TMW3_9BACL|nr:signal recognition particle-docking protein FtsY [Gemella asaccharolytica]KXB58677.1 signal recognition particle-docking protein FtsY [Gemella asaccharolytica]